MSLPGCRFPAAPGPGPRRARNLPGVRPRLGAQPAARSPRRSGRAWEDARTDRRSAGLRARPCALIGRMCLLGSLQLLPSPTGESRESVPAPGSWGLGSVRRAREPGPVGAGGAGPGRAEAAERSGWPRGAPSRSAAPARRRRCARDPAAVGEGGVPCGTPRLGPREGGKGQRGRPGGGLCE